MFQTKVVEKIKTHIYVQERSFENRTVYEAMWKNIVQQGRPQMTIWRMRIKYRITTATDPHSQYGIHIAFPLQQRLRERAPMLRYTYIARLVTSRSYPPPGTPCQHTN